MMSDELRKAAQEVITHFNLGTLKGAPKALVACGDLAAALEQPPPSGEALEALNELWSLANKFYLETIPHNDTIGRAIMHKENLRLKQVVQTAITRPKIYAEGGE